MKSTKIPFLYFILLNLFNITSYAVGAETEHRHALNEAHVHGEVVLKMVKDDSLLEIELISPAANFTGFEHEAQNDEEVEAIEKTNDLLRQYALIFTLPETSCNHSSTAIDQSGLIEYENKETPHDHDGNSEKSEHSEISALYQYDCYGDLSWLKVNLFQFFPKVDRINLQWVNRNGQGRDILTAKQNTVEF